MRRRDFMTIFAGSAAAWPLGARAQQTYHLAVLSGRGRQEPNFLAFFDELRQFGILEGEHLIVDPRGFGVGQDRFAELANKLVSSGPNVILGLTNTPSPQCSVCGPGISCVQRLAKPNCSPNNC
jgi:hypothetical protein